MIDLFGKKEIARLIEENNILTRQLNHDRAVMDNMYRVEITNLQRKVERLISAHELDVKTIKELESKIREQTDDDAALAALRLLGITSHGTRSDRKTVDESNEKRKAEMLRNYQMANIQNETEGERLRRAFQGIAKSNNSHPDGLGRLR